MSDISQIPTSDLAAEMAARLATAENELAGLREQRDLCNELIRAKAPEVEQLRRLVRSLEGKKPKPKPQQPVAPEGSAETPVVSQPVVPPADIVQSVPVDPVAPPAFQPE